MSRDITPPTVLCGQDVSSLVQCGQTNTQVCFQQCSATDNSGTTLTVRYSSGLIQFTPQGNQLCGTFPSGDTTVTATATDNCGLTSSDTITVSVTGGDTFPPRVFCGQDVSSEAQCRQTNARVCFQQCSATDNSGITPTVRYSNGFIQFTPQGNQICATYPSGATTVTATATDNCGLTSFDTLTVTVTGGNITPPTVLCGQDVSSLVQCGQPDLQVCFQRCSATDNSGTTLTLRYISGLIQFTPQGNQFCGTFPSGETTVTATATDNCGLTSSDTITVSVTGGDTFPPRVFCGQDVSSEVQCRQTNARVCFQQCSATDNSGITPTVRYTNGFIQFTPQGNQICATYPSGATTVTATATDNCGLTSSDTLTVTVTGGDITPPTVLCGQDVSSLVQCGQTNTQVCFQQCSATDNSGTTLTVRYSSGLIQFTPQGNQLCGTFPSGDTTVTATATDNCGLTSSDTITLSVTGGDTFPPRVFCGQDVTSEAQCRQTNARICFQQCSATDNSGITPTVRYTNGFIQFTPQGNQICATYPSGATTVTASVTDNCGLTSFDTLTVTVTGATDNSGTTLTLRYSSGVIQFTPQGNQFCGTFPSGETTVTATATDNCGLTSSDTITVSVTGGDTFPPRVFCGQDVSSEVQCRQTNARVCFQQCSATDNSGITPTVRYTNRFIQFTPQGNQICATYPSGATTVTATATDNCGLTSFDTLTVTVTGGNITPPTVLCGQDVSSLVQCGQPDIQVCFQRCSATDNSGTTLTLRYSSGLIQFTPQGNQFCGTFPSGETTVTATATDNCGLTSSDTITVSVTGGDTFPPRVFCGQDVSSEVQCRQTNARVCFQQCSATDNSGITPTVRYTNGFIQFTPQGNQICATYPSGATTVTATATDNCGLTSSDTLTVTVTGGNITPPTVLCGQDVSSLVQCGQPDIQVCFQRCSATDNSGTTLTLRYSSGLIQFTPQGNQFCGTFPSGETTVTATATDNCGLTSSDTITVSVTGGDTFPPRVFCGQDVSSEVQCRQTNARVCFQQCSATDNSGITPTVRYTNGFIQFTPQGNQICATYPSGATTVTATATDNCGLTSFDTLTVTVTGGNITPPTVLCGQDVSSLVQCGQPDIQVCFQRCSATDNSGTTLTLRYSSGLIQFTPQGNQFCGTFPSGETTVTATATDNCGLTSSDTITVSVTGGDTIPPRVFCGQDVSSEAQCRQTNARVCFQQCSATDNSGITPTVRYTNGFIQFTPQGNQICATYPSGATTVTASATDNCGLTSFDTLTVTVTGGK
ncbi:hyalin-like [Amphiura filiformis]|uniref:hyalin-like n=1 Tax=Amphiura filiformis TaxID=82378 RepID=UPI003B22891C